MTEPADSTDEAGQTPPAMPRWVKVMAVVVLAVVVVLVVTMLMVGGEHGPGLHTGAGDRSGLGASTVAGELPAW
jgi:hypothetical protein